MNSPIHPMVSSEVFIEYELLDGKLTPKPVVPKAVAFRNAHVAVCASKIRFTRKAVAREHAKRVARKGRQPNLKPYECPICKGWHVTKKK